MKTARDAGSPNSQMPSLNKRRVTTSTLTQKPHNPSQRPVINVLIQMASDNKSETTIRNYGKWLKVLSQHVDLEQPEAVKKWIAQHNVSAGTKYNITCAYTKYANYYAIEWEKPKYRQAAKPIRIPTRERLQKLIASAGKVLSVKLQTSMETGLRPVELCNLKVKDVDLEQRIIYPTTAKYGASRQLRISVSLASRVGAHINRQHLTADSKLFNGDSDDYGKHYRNHRNQLAEKIQDGALKTIRLYDFRHYFASNLYDKTKDILLVKQQMGHKRLDTTLVYTQLLDLNEDGWTCRTASTVEEAAELIEAGFQYVTEMDGLKLFRKRK